MVGLFHLSFLSWGVTMGKTVNLTLRVPEELHIKMKILPPFAIQVG